MTIIIISLLLLASLLPQLTFTAHVNVGIVNGREAEPHSRPYMVSLQQFGSHTCGGFLISDQFVLTAAHCWTGLLTVVVGAHDLRNSISSDRIRVKSYIPHKNYSSDTFQNDIMLLRLEKKVKLNDNVGLIPIPKEGENVKAGTPCSVAGWGTMANGKMSPVLREANTYTKNPETCVSAWKKEQKKFLDSQMICVHRGDGGSCFGDSGGPLVCGGKAVGVTSFGFKIICNSYTLPNVYTKVSAYRQWINKEIGNIK